MSYLPFPADSAEFEEYTAAMESMADAADALPDPEPEDFGGRCEDAPCCGCCGNDSEPEPDNFGGDDYANGAPDDSYLDEEDHGSYHSEGDEDRYLDSYWEDQSEYGMDGCCGDF